MRSNTQLMIAAPVLATGLLLAALSHWSTVPRTLSPAIQVMAVSVILSVAAAIAVRCCIQPDQPATSLTSIIRNAVVRGNTGTVEHPAGFAEGELPDDVRTLLSEIDAAFEQVRRDTRARTDFVANMSHELRTPLNSIIGFAEVLREPVFGELSDEQQSYVNDILDSGRHLLALINDILDLSKIESGTMTFEPEQIDLPALINGSLRMFREKALKHGITLEFTAAEDIRFIEADERKVKQILFNLLSNAVKFTPDSGQILVHVERRNSNARITVNDSGCGIAEDRLERVFENFFQVNSKLTSSQEGTGLGLPLVRQICIMHSGRVWCESQPGKGCRFIVELPLEQHDTSETFNHLRAGSDANVNNDVSTAHA